MRALPMGYLIAGRIGTGKTFIVQCWAGELGVPCVVFKNFRDRWVGATESNLEKIFAVLRALGQVVVFVDEADQAAGKRESSRRRQRPVGPRLLDAREGNVRHAQPRPHHLGVCDVAAGSARSRPEAPGAAGRAHSAVRAADRRGAARSARGGGEEAQVAADGGRHPGAAVRIVTLGGNEIEGILVRALRTWELRRRPKRPLKDLLADAFSDVRPSAHTRKLEYMDLVAVKECTDARFLPPRYRDDGTRGARRSYRRAAAFHVTLPGRGQLGAESSSQARRQMANICDESDGCSAGFSACSSAGSKRRIPKRSWKRRARSSATR